ncbi:hypothetical protein IID23_01790, partial [Patescibacteria group bacterium]|nr:hypothetical protein [Patescibacteria group bacterium]
MSKPSEGLLKTPRSFTRSGAKKLKHLIFTFLIFSFIFTSFASLTYATHNESTQSLQSEPIQKVSQTSQEDKTSTSSKKTASDEEGEVLVAPLIPVAIIGGLILFEEIFGPGFLQKGFDCAKNTSECIQTALYTVEDAAHTQVTGCSALTEINKSAVEGKIGTGEIALKPGEDLGCAESKINAALQGVDSFADIHYPGLLDYLGYVGSQSLTLPVPINSTQYFASINPFSEARAAGADELADNRVILGIWLRVRNVAYALSAVVLMIIGFMIMLRWRLDPRTVVTVQNSLPRIVIALILITFSFAISGFMIDITRLITQLVMSLIPISGQALLGLAAIGLLMITSGLLVIAPTGPNVGAIALFLLILALILAVMILIIFVILIYKLLKRYI